MAIRTRFRGTSRRFRRGAPTRRRVRGSFRRRSMRGRRRVARSRRARPLHIGFRM